MLKVILNDNKEIVKKIQKGLKNTGGYCPCSFIQNENTKCICKEFREQNFEGLCHCQLYKKINI